MKILVVSGFAADSRLAHAINTIKMADGFAKLGHQVALLCRRGAERPVPAETLRADFALDRRLAVMQVRQSLFGRPLDEHVHLALQTGWPAMRLRPDLVYCRSYVAPAMLSRLGVTVVAESHAHPGATSRHLRRMARATTRPSFRALVTIAPILREHFVSLSVPADKILVLPDAVDLSMFRRPAGWRRPAGSGRPLIVYAGHLYDYKGIPAVLGAAALLPDCDFRLVGGQPEDVARQAGRIAAAGLGNVTLTGMLPHSAVPAELWKADVLLLPPSARHPSAAWTSPVKLGEYLASGVPVVATRIPALEHWLGDGAAVFAEPDDAASLAAAIRRLLDDGRLAEAVACRGLALAETLSYEARCARIIEKAFG